VALRPNPMPKKLEEKRLTEKAPYKFEKNGRELRVRVDGQLAFNNVSMIRRAARAGFGLCCLVEDHFAADTAEGRLVRVLEDWCPPFPGYHLYYPSRRQPSAAFTLLVEALRSLA
jgi:DNA-binding transcriptional LysR family regulator